MNEIHGEIMKEAKALYNLQKVPGSPEFEDADSVTKVKFIHQLMDSYKQMRESPLEVSDD